MVKEKKANRLKNAQKSKKVTTTKKRNKMAKTQKTTKLKKVKTFSHVTLKNCLDRNFIIY